MKKTKRGPFLYNIVYNNHIIANCLQSAPVKEFWKSVNNRRRYWQK